MKWSDAISAVLSVDFHKCDEARRWQMKSEVASFDAMVSNYLSKLNGSFIHYDGELSKSEFLSSFVFDFVTYEEKFTELFVAKALEVCDAVSQGKTFDYIADEERRQWYLLMVNMPFFVDRLSWGSSIRGAWWEFIQPDIGDHGAFGVRDSDQMEAFTKAMLMFIGSENEVA